MQFNLRLFQIALLAEVCLTSFGYSASRDAVAASDFLPIEDAVVEPQPKRVIGPGQAVNDKDLRTEFFNGFAGDKVKLLKALIGIATTKGDIGLAHEAFLAEATARAFFTMESLDTIRVTEAITSSGEKVLLVDHLLNIARCGAKQQLLPIKVFTAFAVPRTLHIEPADLPGALRIAPAASTLPTSESVYVLNVRSNLGKAELDAALARPDEILVLTQQGAIAEKTAESYERSASLVSLVGKLRGISPIVSAYLLLVRTQLAAIVPAEERVVPGTVFGSYWGSSVREFSADQQLKRAALQTRQELALAVFDAFFGTIAKPAAVPVAVDFRIDQSPANRLVSAVHAVHATLPAIVASNAFTVNSNGTIGDEAENSATALICGETTVFLKQVWAAVILTDNTAITEFVAPVKKVAEHKE